MAEYAPKDISEVFAEPALEGWDKDTSSIFGEKIIRWTRDGQTLSAQLLGGKRSRHPNLEAFRESHEFRDDDGSPAEQTGSIEKNGKTVAIYERAYSLTKKKDAHGEIRKNISERIALAAAGERFLVLTWSAQNPDPASQPEWEKLLASIR